MDEAVEKKEPGAEGEAPKATGNKISPISVVAFVLSVVLLVGWFLFLIHKEAAPETTLTQPVQWTVSPAITFSSSSEYDWRKIEEAPAPVRIPRKVTIGPYVYRLSWRTPEVMGPYHGRTYLDTQEFILRSDLPVTGQRETLLHEIMHACASMGLRTLITDQGDDQWIKAISPCMVMVMRDNPEIVLWMTGK